MSGNTIGSVVGAAVGFVVSGFNPVGAKWGFMIGGMIGGYVDPVKIQGPRLSDATRQTSQEGVPIPWGYGTFPTAGNIIFAGPLVEHEHSEGGKGGPQTINYTYTRSYAIGICEGPISGIQKIKRNGKLVYDISPTSTIMGENAKFLEKCTIYLGDETQLVDPTIEAIVGVGNTGPYRGLAYIVMEDDDLTETQGAISQYEFVVQMCGTVTTTPAFAIGDLNPEFWYPLTDGGDTGLDVMANLLPLEFDTPGNYSSGAGGLTFLTNEGEASVVTGTPALESPNEHILIQVKARVDSAEDTPTSMRWIAGLMNNHLFEYYRWAIFLGGPNMMTPCVGYGNAGGGGVVAMADFEAAVGKSYVYGLQRDGDDLNLLVNGAIAATVDCSFNSFSGNGTLMLGGHFDPIRFGSRMTVSDLIGVPQAVTPTEAALASYAVGVVPDGYYAVPDAPGVLVDADGNYVGGSTEAASISSCQAILADIFDDLCERSAIDVATEVDSSQLTDVVTGFKCATESSAEGFIESLTLSHFFDRGEWDKKVRGIKRGGANLFALTPDDLVYRDGPSIEWTQIQEPELLRKVNVLSLDPAADYNMTKQTWERRAGTVRAKGEASVEIPEVVETDTAAQIAEIRGKLAWAENAKAKFALTVKWSKLTPTDTGTFTDKNGIIHRIRLADMNEELGVFQIEEAPKDRASVYVGTATGVTNTNNPGSTSPGLIGPTLLAIMNLPRLRSQDSTPGVYLGIAGILPGWHGGSVLFSFDSGVTYQTLFSTIIASTLGPLTAGITDSSEPLSVHAYGGRLASMGPEQLAIGLNALAVTTAGTSEILNFADADETATDYYDLTTLGRGIKGTTAASHASGDMFADLSTVHFLPIDVGFAGQTLYVKAVSAGTSADAVEGVPFVYAPQFIGPEVVDFEQTSSGAYVTTDTGNYIEVIS